MINTYRSRIEQLQKDMGCDKYDLAERLRKRVEEEGSPFSLSDYQASSWFSLDEQALPTAEAFPFIADALKTNVGYLLGLHEVKEMTNPRLLLNVDIESCEEEYRRKHEGRSLTKDRVVYSQWYLNIKRGSDQTHKRIKPFVSLSAAVGWDIDYILGLTDIRYWQYFCLEHGLLDRLNPGMKFLLSDNRTIAMLSHNGLFLIVENGMLRKLALPELLKQKPKIISGYELLD